MPISLEWSDIAWRLALAAAAGAIFGLERGEHGRAAGLRTMLLVALAACLAMILANTLLPTAGRRPDSFVSFDVMRLPLGILSGIGFIGGGAILHRRALVVGVTTAATLWFVTVVGLVFGAGQLELGLAVTAASFVVVWSLRWLERRLPEDRRATLELAADANGPGEADIRAELEAGRMRIAALALTYAPVEQRTTFRCDVRWRGRAGLTETPECLNRIARLPGLVRLEWRPG